MWIILTILAAFFNALWSALSKRQLGELSPYQFTLMFRAITALLLLPPFFMATLLYYLAVELAPITKVNPLVRTNLLFGFMLSYYLLKEKDHIKRKILASILIILGAVLISVS